MSTLIISKFNQIFLVRHQRPPANDKAHDEEKELNKIKYRYLSDVFN